MDTFLLDMRCLQVQHKIKITQQLRDFQNAPRNECLEDKGKEKDIQQSLKPMNKGCIEGTQKSNRV